MPESAPGGAVSAPGGECLVRGVSAPGGVCLEGVCSWGVCSGGSAPRGCLLWCKSMPLVRRGLTLLLLLVARHIK